MVPLNEWRWFGFPAHFCGSRSCQFHLATQVGDYIISTVGDYRPGGGKRETIGAGADDFFETYVFEAGELCRVPGCECGMPTLATSIEVDGVRAANAKEAHANHQMFCLRYAELQEPK